MTYLLVGRRNPLTLLFLALILMPLVSSQFGYEDVELFFSDRGVVNVSRGGFNVGTGSITTWGPNWVWEDACSSPSSWNIIGGPLATETLFEVECYSKCSFASIAWRIKAWAGLNAMLIEINATADDDSSFAGLAWDYEVPVALYRGKTVYALFPNGSTVKIALREEHVPGNWSLYYSSGGVGWIVPFEDGGGIVVAVFGDLWPSGMDLEVQDLREWSGNTYTLRNWFFYSIDMTAGQRLRVLVYLYPYSNNETLAQAKASIVGVMQRFSIGESLSTIKADLIRALKLEEAAAERRSAGPPPFMVVYVVVVAIVGVVISYALLKRRR